MSFKLKYGKGEVPVEIPDSVEADLIEPALLPAVGDVHDALLSALEDPIGSPPLRKIMPSSGEVAIVVSDKTRPCKYPVVLPHLLNYINALGLGDDRMFLLAAYGGHRRHTDDENRTFYGEESIRRLRLFHHDACDESRVQSVGKTPLGTSVQLNSQYLQAAMSIVLTSVSFHYFAGFGGGRKAIFPGLASKEGILRNHRIFVQSVGDSLSRIHDFKGELDNNPLHEDLMDAVSMAPPSFVLNFCLNREEEVSGIFVGDWKESHRRACRFLLQTRLPPRQRYDLVVASCGGHPKDVNFIQVHKTIDNAFAFVRSGGALLIVASSEDGIGSQSFLRWFDHEDATAMRKALLQEYSMNGGTALALKVKADSCPIYLYSSLDPAVVKKMGLRPIPDIRQALDEIVSGQRVKHAAVLPEGAITIAERESNAGP